MTNIHPTALVDPKVEFAGDVTVGPYSIIRGNVRVGAGTIIDAHSHVSGRTVIGRNCRIGPAAYVGMDPQDLKYKGDETDLVIGDDVIIRECASVHRANKPGTEHATRVGNGCFLMAGSHVGHNSVLENHVVMANAVLLAGHVTVGERAFLGGGFVFHQFCRIGRLAVIAGGEALNQDVPPFAAVRYGRLKGYNAVGCRRSGMSAKAVNQLRAAFRCLSAHRLVSDAVGAIKAEVESIPEVAELLEFIGGSKRGIVPSMSPQLRGRSAGEIEPQES
jgi:UDP-N-acetylglucosamine acyltransferase